MIDKIGACNVAIQLKQNNIKGKYYFGGALCATTIVKAGDYWTV